MTSRTLREVLRGPDCAERRRRAGELAAIYQPVWESTAKRVLRRYSGQNATLDASDVVGDEVVQMLSPESEYFRTYDEARGGLRAWIRARIANRAIDLLRRKRGKALDSVAEAATIQSWVDEREMYELFRDAFAIAQDLCVLRNASQDMEIFRAVRSVSARLAPEERRARGWTEWQEREAVSQVWAIVREEAIPMAAAKVSDTPQETVELAQALWDAMRNRRKVQLP